MKNKVDLDYIYYQLDKDQDNILSPHDFYSERLFKFLFGGVTIIDKSVFLPKFQPKS